MQQDEWYTQLDVMDAAAGNGGVYNSMALDSLEGCSESACGMGGKPVACQVKGCQVNLRLVDKTYCIRKRICPYHMTAPLVELEDPQAGDEPYRFCHQCGKFEPVSRFDGSRRSCRARLLRRRTNQQQARLQSQPGSATEPGQRASNNRRSKRRAMRVLSSSDEEDSHNADDEAEQDAAAAAPMFAGRAAHAVAAAAGRVKREADPDPDFVASKHKKAKFSSKEHAAAAPVARTPLRGLQQRRLQQRRAALVLQRRKQQQKQQEQVAAQAAAAAAAVADDAVGPLSCFMGLQMVQQTADAAADPAAFAGAAAAAAPAALATALSLNNSEGSVESHAGLLGMHSHRDAAVPQRNQQQLRQPQKEPQLPQQLQQQDRCTAEYQPDHQACWGDAGFVQTAEAVMAAEDVLTLDGIEASLIRELEAELMFEHMLDEQQQQGSACTAAANLARLDSIDGSMAYPPAPQYTGRQVAGQLQCQFGGPSSSNNNRQITNSNNNGRSMAGTGSAGTRPRQCAPIMAPPAAVGVPAACAMPAASAAGSGASHATAAAAQAAAAAALGVRASGLERLRLHMKQQLLGNSSSHAAAPAVHATVAAYAGSIGSMVELPAAAAATPSAQKMELVNKLIDVMYGDAMATVEELEACAMSVSAQCQQRMSMEQQQAVMEQQQQQALQLQQRSSAAYSAMHAQQAMQASAGPYMSGAASGGAAAAAAAGSMMNPCSGMTNASPVAAAAPTPASAGGCSWASAGRSRQCFTTSWVAAGGARLPSNNVMDRAGSMGSGAGVSQMMHPALFNRAAQGCQAGSASASPQQQVASPAATVAVPAATTPTEATANRLAELQHQMCVVSAQLQQLQEVMLATATVKADTAMPSHYTYMMQQQSSSPLMQQLSVTSSNAGAGLQTPRMQQQ